MSNSYIQRIRQQLGTNSFIHPAARIIIQNQAEEILFIRRIDTGKLGIPAGSFEEGETIEEAIRREVKEETGLELGELEVIGISSNPLVESVSYPNGDQIQYFTIEFFSKQFSGNLTPDHVETKEVFFGSRDLFQELPTNEQSAFQSLVYFEATHKIRLN